MGARRTWEHRCQATRRGELPSPAMAAAENPSFENTEGPTIYPRGSLSEAFAPALDA